MSSTLMTSMRMPVGFHLSYEHICDETFAVLYTISSHLVTPVDFICLTSYSRDSIYTTYTSHHADC